jgi:hypothetical protein
MTPGEEQEPSAEEFEAAARVFLAAEGFPAATLHALSGGRNNRVFTVESPEGRALLKWYFVHPADTRDRLRAEFEFAAFAWNHGVRALARPLAREESLHLGLYEFLDGRGLRPGDIDAATVDQAARFFADVNRYRSSALEALSAGSEACFSIEEHRGLVTGRVERLAHLEVLDEVGARAADFVATRLTPLLAEITGWVGNHAGSRDVLPPDARCLSPSDFGFHNALRAPDGTLRFLDFEYAGWDDPARMVCDFFWQPAVPVPEKHLAAFCSQALTGFPNTGELLERITVLRPLYGLKWCCIVLNDFLPLGSRRRRFADPERTVDHQIRQLDLASDLLRRTEDLYVATA